MLLYGGMLMYLLSSNYRPHRRLQLAVVVVFCSGLSVSLYGTGSGVLHLPPPAAATWSALCTVVVFRFTLRKVDRDTQQMLSVFFKQLSDSAHADQMYRDCQRALRKSRPGSEEYKTARVNEARALVARSVADGFPDGHVKAIKHGDLAGYLMALDMLHAAAGRAPPDAGVMASVHYLTAEYQATLASRTSGQEAEAHADAVIAGLRQSIAAVTRIRRGMLPGLYAKLGWYVANRRKEPGDLDEGIALCRHGRRLARYSPWARVLPDLMLASLLLDRTWETALSVDDATADAAVAAAGSSIRRDLRGAAALLRRARRYGSSQQQIEVLELRAQLEAAREEIFGEAQRRPAVAAASRAAALASTRGSVPGMVMLGRAWVEWAEATGEARWCAEAYQHLMSLVPRAVASRYLAAERDRLLTDVQQSAEEAGYWLASLGRLRDAAVALELGRAVSISEVVGRERPDVSQVLALAGLPELGERYAQAAAALSTGSLRPAPPDSLSSSAQRAWSEYDALLREVATVEGAEHIVAPVDYADLATAAQDGPLVYLAAAEELGYAIVVTTADEPQLVLLPLLTRQRVRQQVVGALETTDRQSVATTLRWLWQNGISDLADWLPEHALVTLVPVGLLGLLPVHAAGGPSGPGVAPADWDYLADRVTVRYALNARTLLRARARAADCERAPMTLLAVDAPNGDRQRPLRWTRPELEEVDRCWRSTGGRSTMLVRCP